MHCCLILTSTLKETETINIINDLYYYSKNKGFFLPIIRNVLVPLASVQHNETYQRTFNCHILTKWTRKALIWSASKALLKHSLIESSEPIPRIMVARLRVEGTGDLNCRRAQLRLVISVTYCVTWVSYLPPLRLSFFVCYMQITSTLQLLGGSS